MIVDAHMHLSGNGYVRGKYLKFVWTMYSAHQTIHNKINRRFMGELLPVCPPWFARTTLTVQRSNLHVPTLRPRTSLDPPLNGIRKGTFMGLPRSLTRG